MKVVRVASTALNQIPMNWKHNTNNIIQAINEANKKAVNVLCLPELSITGYGCEDYFHSQDLLVRARKQLDIIKRSNQYNSMVVSVGLPILHKGSIFNCSAILFNDNILGYVAKRNLAGDGNHYEPRFFHSWPDGIKSRTEDGIAIGDIHFNIGGIKIGEEVCEDAWVANRPGVALASQGVDIILNPSASHFAFDKDQIRERFVIEGSRAFNCVYVYANLLGNEAGRMIYSGDTLIASGGEIINAGETLSYKDRVMITAVIDIDTNRVNRARSGSYKPSVQSSNLCINVEESCSGGLIEEERHSIHNFTKDQQFEKAVGLGLFDYLRKSKSQGFVISLSGGADSATIAFLIYFMVEEAVKELGLAGFKSKLSHIDFKEATTTKELVGKILTCVYQSSDNSSDTTFEAAKEVAESIGAVFHFIRITQIINQYVQRVEDTIGRKLTWETDDITLQNIQARVRSPSAWLYANIEHKLLLTTSNRSEAAVGYATMDGDTSGSLAPIAGIDKFFIKNWLAYKLLQCQESSLEKAFGFIVGQTPTAELRPTKQTDEEDLMPYDMLDLIECLAIKDKKSPLEIYKTIQATKKQDNKILAGWVDKFFRMWCRNQWKRERYAPSFQLDQTNLDPKSWCRFPILNSGFEEELKEMWDNVR